MPVLVGRGVSKEETASSSEQHTTVHSHYHSKYICCPSWTGHFVALWECSANHPTHYTRQPPPTHYTLHTKASTHHTQPTLTCSLPGPHSRCSPSSLHTPHVLQLSPWICHSNVGPLPPCRVETIGGINRHSCSPQWEAIVTILTE